MAAPLEFKRRVRLPEPLEEERPKRRRSLAPLGAVSWILTVGLAIAISEGVVPIDRWLQIETPAVVAVLARPAAHPKPELAPLPIAGAEPAALDLSEPTDPVELASVDSEEPPFAAPPEPSEASAEPPPAASADDPALEAKATAEPGPAPEPRPAPEAPSSVAQAGKSCEQAAAEAQQSIEIGKSRGPADLERHDYAAVLDRGSYFEHCGAPDNVRIDVCAAVQNGHAVGVTVRTTPGMSSVAGCVARAVRGLSFPRHPRLDVVRTTFAAE
jgi:hypothetical protein